MKTLLSLFTFASIAILLMGCGGSGDGTTTVNLSNSDAAKKQWSKIINSMEFQEEQEFKKTLIALACGASDHGGGVLIEDGEIAAVQRRMVAILDGKSVDEILELWEVVGLVNEGLRLRGTTYVGEEKSIRFKLEETE